MSQDLAHDVWMTILELVDDIGTLKACNLVCARWHLRVQARLFSSITIKWDENPLTTEDLQRLQPLSHLIQRLGLRVSWIWSPAVTKPPHVMLRSFLPLSMFHHLKELELCRVSFLRFSDLRHYFSNIGTVFDTLKLVECRAGDEDVVRTMYYPLTTHAPTQPFGPSIDDSIYRHGIALRNLHMDSAHDDSFNAIVLQWLALSPTQHTLRTLALSVTVQDDTVLDFLAAFMAHSACQLQELKLCFQDGSRVGGYYSKSR
jgi:hypothetical protein